MISRWEKISRPDQIVIIAWFVSLFYFWQSDWNEKMRDMRTFLDSAQAFLITSIIKVLAASAASHAAEKSVAYAWNSSYDACIYIKVIKHVKICYYIYFKHDISRKSAVQLLLFFVVKRRKLQCSGLTSKHSNSFVIVFIVWR